MDPFDVVQQRTRAGVDLTRRLRAAHAGKMPEPKELLEEARAFEVKTLKLNVSRIDWCDASPTWRPFLANPAPGNGALCEVLQEAIVRRVFQIDDELIVFPAAGLDERVFPARGTLLTIGPYERTAQPHIEKRAHEVAPDDIAQFQHGRPTALVVKGLQSVVDRLGLRRFIRLVAPQRVLLAGSAARPTGEPQAFPTWSDDLLDLIADEGFEDVTTRQFTDQELTFIQKTHDMLQHWYSWNEGGWFPLTRLAVFAA